MDSNRLKKTLGIFLAVLFLVTVTAGSVSANTGSASFTYTIKGLTVSFQGKTTGSNGLMWGCDWNFGDGQRVYGSLTYGINDPHYGVPVAPVHTYASPGIYTVTFNAHMHASPFPYILTTSQTIFVGTPVQKIQIIVNMVQNLNMNHGQENSLLVKLNAATENLNNENTQAATGELNAFINEVGAKIKSGTLTSTQRQALIDAANSVIDAIK